MLEDGTAGFEQLAIATGPKLSDGAQGDDRLAPRQAGARAVGTKQRLADAFTGAFDDPLVMVDTLEELGRTRRFIAETAGMAMDWDVAKRFLALGARQLRNTLRV